MSSKDYSAAEEEARQVVAEYLAESLDLEENNGKLLPDTKGIALKLYALRLIQDNQQNPHAIIQQAERDPIAWEACAQLLTAQPTRDGYLNLIPEGLSDKIKPELMEWASKALRGEITRPMRAPSDTILRDLTIALAVYRATQCSLPAYFNGIKTRKTACDIVAEVTGLAEGTVQEIWRSYPPEFRGGKIK